MSDIKKQSKNCKPGDVLYVGDKKFVCTRKPGNRPITLDDVDISTAVTTVDANDVIIELLQILNQNLAMLVNEVQDIKDEISWRGGYQSMEVVIPAGKVKQELLFDPPARMLHMRFDRGFLLYLNDKDNDPIELTAAEDPYQLDGLSSRNVVHTIFITNQDVDNAMTITTLHFG